MISPLYVIDMTAYFQGSGHDILLIGHGWFNDHFPVPVLGALRSRRRGADGADGADARGAATSAALRAGLEVEVQ